jgi:hypothetical protein
MKESTDTGGNENGVVNAPVELDAGALFVLKSGG